jgi:hypothetical protein
MLKQQSGSMHQQHKTAHGQPHVRVTVTDTIFT